MNMTTIDQSVDFATATGGGHWESKTNTSASTFVQGDWYRITSIMGTQVFRYTGQSRIVLGSVMVQNSSSSNIEERSVWYSFGSSSLGDGFYEYHPDQEWNTRNTLPSEDRTIQLEHWVPDA